MNSTKNSKKEIETLSNISKILDLAVSKFDERFKWLAKEGTISLDVSKTIRNLHEYRNQYLHRQKIKENDSIAYAKLYLYLFQQLFLAIPVNRFSSTDSNNSDIVREVLSKSYYPFPEDVFKSKLLECLNSKYELSFNLKEFLVILQGFLLDKYNNIIDLIHFIIENTNNRIQEIDFLETACHTGKISISPPMDCDDSFICASAKTQQILGNIRKLSQAKDEHTGLQKFNEQYRRIMVLEEPIFVHASKIEEDIQLQSDILRGK